MIDTNGLMRQMFQLTFEDVKKVLHSGDKAEIKEVTSDQGKAIQQYIESLGFTRGQIIVLGMGLVLTNFPLYCVEHGPEMRELHAALTSK